MRLFNKYIRRHRLLKMQKTTIQCTKDKNITFPEGKWRASHRVMVLAEGNDLGIVFEALTQSQLGDSLHGQTQQVGTQRCMLRLRE